MREKLISTLGDDELIDALVVATHAWGEASQAGNVSLVNKLFVKLAKIRDELKLRGTDCRLRLAPLLDSRDPGIRLQVGYELLALLPDRARAAIESIAEAGLYGLSLSAKMFLLAVDEGRYVPK